MSKQILTDFDMNSVSKIINLPVPVNDGDAANKSYVDSAVEGISWKESVKVASESNITLSSPGATIDSVALSTGDRVLIKSQTDATENGIYDFNGASSSMTRSGDANTEAELRQAVVTIQDGTSVGSSFRLTSVGFTIGSDALNWSVFGASVGAASTTTAGVVELATQAEVDAGTDTLKPVVSSTLANFSGLKKKYTTTIGDGSATSYVITHNFGTRDVTVNVYKNSGTYSEVVVDIEHTTTNTVTIKFVSAPASNSYNVTIIG